MAQQENSAPSSASRTPAFIDVAVLVLGLSWVAFQTLIMFYPQQPLIQRPLHLGFALALTILWRPLRRTRRAKLAPVIDGVLVVSVVAIVAYFMAAADRLVGRMEFVDPILAVDVAFGVLTVVILLECVRRVIGWSLLGVILAFLVYAFLGKVWSGWVHVEWVPELFRFSGFTLSEAAENFTMKANGVLGITTYTSVLFVFYFVLFGAVYSAIGGGQLFIDIGLTVAGRRRAGASKAAVISSGLMGSISGSAVANVATTGLFTIPLMRRTGYAPTFAGAVEAIASTGGQLMPPVMGVAAFVMAELLQVSYARVALAGVIPAVAFYLSLFFLLDFHSRKTGVGTASGDALTTAPLLPRLYLLIPPVVLVTLLANGFSAGLSALYATAICVPIAYLKRQTRLHFSGWLKALRDGTRQASEVAVPIAAIGIIIEVCVQSNLTLEFSSQLAQLSGGTLIGALAMIVVGCLIMGMGLPTVAAYIIGATLFVPALLGLGVKELPAHFFVMYYCVLSMVTPPVALASYTAAGLSGANSMTTSFYAFRFSLVAFFIPFAFVLEPALLGLGTAGRIVASTTVLAVGILGWASAMEGYFLRRLSVAPRVLIGLTSFAVILAPIVIHFVGDGSDRASMAIPFAAAVTLLVLLGVATLLSRSTERADSQSAKT